MARPKTIKDKPVAIDRQLTVGFLLPSARLAFATQKKSPRAIDLSHLARGVVVGSGGGGSSNETATTREREREGDEA